MSQAGQTDLPEDNCDTKMESRLIDKGAEGNQNSNSTLAYDDAPPLPKLLEPREMQLNEEIKGGEEELQKLPPIHEDSISCGKLFCIVIGTEDRDVKTRTGAEVDLANLINVFCDKLKFTWANKKSCQNLKSSDFYCQIKNIKNSVFEFNTESLPCSCLICRIHSQDYTHCEALVFAVSAHGCISVNKQKKKDTCFKLADGNRVFVSDVLDLIEDEHCPTLKDKPKIFICQFCRAERQSKDSDDRGVMCPDPDPAHPTPADTNDDFADDDEATSDTDDCAGEDEATSDTDDCAGEDEATSDTDDCAGEDEATSDTDVDHTEDESDALAHGNRTTDFDEEKVLDVSYGGALHKDQFVVYAAPPGKVAKRNRKNGSWMLHQLNVIMEKHNSTKSIDLQQVFTRVANGMSGMATTVWKLDKNNELIKDGNGKKILVEEKSNFKSVLCTTNTLTKPLVLNKKVSDNGAGKNEPMNNERTSALPTPDLPKAAITIDDPMSENQNGNVCDIMASTEDTASEETMLAGLKIDDI